MRLSLEAQSDIASTSRWLAEQGVPMRIVRGYFAKLRSRYVSLGSTPWIGPPREDLGPDLRGLAAPSATIIYRVESERVLILRILRRGRDVGAQFTP